MANREAAVMSEKDYIGRRGEIIFEYLIGKKCKGRFWFQTTFAGDKAETKDFIVNLIEPSTGEATFFAQVKATSKGYSGKRSARKLRVNVTKKDMKKLKSVNGPAFVVGIDVERQTGYLVAITAETGDRLSGLPCTHKIGCELIEKLWKEIDAYWAKRKMLAEKSLFS
ncbi:MAG: DUF4365 domain-containing protein [Gemmataceae bacterium]|nr:DUF4365 domain-containing protein [Gemmataceae bacterium]